MANNLLAGATLVLCLLGAGCTIGAFYMEEWVSFEGSTGNEFVWGLLHCNDCPDSSEGITWFCYDQFACEREDEANSSAIEDVYSGMCDTGRDLGLAGFMYWVCSLVAIVLMF
jgi:hypothetical protein